MSVEDFIIAVFCIIDDELAKTLDSIKLRKRGRTPGLIDSEVLTIEIVGEFLGLDTDIGIWRYFRTLWKHFFPDIPDRSNFARQAANLHIIKRLLQERMGTALGAHLDTLHIMDGLPMPVCKFARAHFSRIFKGTATYGYCATKQERYYGFKGRLTERFHIERIRAQDLWHQASRFWRKLLSHTVCVKIKIERGVEPLQFEQLIA